MSDPRVRLDEPGQFAVGQVDGVGQDGPGAEATTGLRQGREIGLSGVPDGSRPGASRIA